MTTLRVAAAAWPIERHDHWDSFAAKAERWTAEAAANGAALLLLPEYGSMELTSLLPAEIGGDLHRGLRGMQALLEPFQNLWRGLAARHRVTIVAPSFPVAHGDVFLNEAWVHAPGGSAIQAKRHMTRFEAETWGISPGRELLLFEASVKFGVAICYDAEFPLHVRSLVEAGAELILVPSCTDAEAGYTRVAVSARARAIENQCFVVQSSTVGDAPWSPAVDSNVGAPGFYAPADRGFPPDGILARGILNLPGWTYADLDFDKLRAVRTDGQVLNHRDWGAGEYPKPKLVRLLEAS